MRMSRHNKQRRGAIIPLIAFSLVALLGMVALAIDIGMVAVAKNQAQNAADASASAAVRTFTNNTGYNLPQAPVNGVAAAIANQILGQNITGDPKSIANPATDVYTSGQVTITAGGYYYTYNDSNPASEGFSFVIPGKIGTEPYTAVKATIQSTSPVFFGKVFGTNPFNVTASAIAAFRPRDVAIIMDLSGSMRFQTCPGGYADGSGDVAPNWGPRNTPLNPDTNYPTFGHYTGNSSLLYGNTSYPYAGVIVDPGNLVVSALGGSAIAADFMSSGSTPAFTAAAISQATTPGGDNYLKSGPNYIKTLTDVIGANPTPQQMLTWCRNGYPTYNGNVAFNKYTAGPNYWGKTFFIWPPDPRGSDLDANVTANHADNGAYDWRQRFFFKQNTTTNTLYWLDHNTIMFDPNGQTATSWNTYTPCIKNPDQTTTVTENGQQVTYRYLINYAAIFQWLRNTDPKFFPNSMLTGRIQYYTKIPDPTGDSTFNNRFWTQSPMTDLSERFWKDYVDFMLGQVEAGANTYNNNDGVIPYTAYIGTGDMFSWGTTQVKQKPDCNYTATVNNAGGYAAGYNGVVYLNNVKTLGGSAVDLPGPNAITNATALTPVKITSANHGLSTGNQVNVQAVGGTIGVTVNNSAVKPNPWTVTVIDANTFSLNGSVGVGTYTANTGVWMPAITNATNASPIVITTAAPHGLTNATPATVVISNVTGNTAANGKWAINVIDSTHFSLTGSSGNGAYTNNPLGTQWWEPVYYIRFGYGSTFFELSPTVISSGTLAGTPDLALTTAVANASAVKIYTTVPKYMDYNDNTMRPLHQFWFGPQTWIDWLGNYSIYNLRWPGNTHEAQSWSCKVGISAAITDIQNNHPNDFVGLTFFSTPSYSKNGGGQFNCAVVPLGRNYQQMRDSLWFPPSTVTGSATSITPYDTDFANVPRAQGGTAPQMGFMISYNMLSSSVANLRTYAQPTKNYRGLDGGMGRKGAQRMVIFETDGDPNTAATATIAGSGTDAYYPIRIYDPTNINNSSNEFPAIPSYQDSDVYGIVQQIAAQTTATPPGYSTTRKPALVYSIGYGSLFDPANTSNSTGQTHALTFLQTIQYYGNTSPNTSAASFPMSQRIYGDPATRSKQLQAAFTNIMQVNAPVVLLQ